MSRIALLLTATSLAVAGVVINAEVSREPVMAERGREERDAPKWAEEFKVKREEIFEFSQKPQVTREGDRVTISFETKGFCDVTVAIEDPNGKIVRHLASGVLGPNAPPPFAKNSKAQTLVWDGKDDAGRYVDQKDVLRVRVSLGLSPRFERTLFWHPGKSAGGVYAFAPAPEGVFVFMSGNAVDHLRLFDHAGNYVRTIYPFPAQKLGEIPDLFWHRFPDGAMIPVKPNWLQSTFLMSGSNCTKPTYRDGRYSGYGPRGTELQGSAGFSLAWADGALALVGHAVSRISTAGESGTRKLYGPEVSFRDKATFFKADERREEDDFDSVSPRRCALSPDKRWLYLARFNETRPGSFGCVVWRNMVMRVPYDEQTPGEFFRGKPDPGSTDEEFNMPADVACDARGRVYVADHLNDRVQVFNSDGVLLRSLPVRRPVRLSLDWKTGAIYVFSWALPLHGRTSFLGSDPSLARKGEAETWFRLIRISSVDQPDERQMWDLQRVTGLRRTRASNIEIEAAVDTWSDPLRLWITAPSPVGSRETRGLGLVVLKLESGEWQLERDFLDEAAKDICRVKPAVFNRQRLYVNPVNGTLYLVEGDSSHGKAFQRTLQIDPETGRVRQIELPMSAEDMAFDYEGNLYLRTSYMILRYSSDDLREIPFDYGESHPRHHYGSGGGERSAPVISGAVFPGNKGFHQGGMHVSARGHIVVGALYDTKLKGAKEDVVIPGAKPYQPTLYPGRRWGDGSRLGCMVIHVLDRDGKALYLDAVPGLHEHVNGVAIDERDDVYLLNASPRIFEGELHFNDHAGTLMKFSPGKGKILSVEETPVPLAKKPNRPPDLGLPKAWVEGAHWMYPGVGWGGQNHPSGCSCPNARFALDYFGRSFTPEIDRYNVGVLDSNGNLILRVGRCGNVDDGLPLIKEGGPANPRSIGGDETALFYAPYVATHTDRRLFIADPGNARIVSVRLVYHAEEIVALKDVPDKAAE
ncbi:MAG: hypothetical protein ACUVWX_09290 [Kiritimatiellia bacterium]